MKAAKVALLLSLGAIAGAPQMLPAQDSRDREERRDSNRDLRDAIQKLQSARHDLALADRKFHGERGDALEQTQYAIEQLFAALNDDRWKEEDRQLWERQSREIRDRVDRREDLGSDRDRDRYVRAESGLRNLRDARRLVERVDGAGYGGHKSKALVHLDEAISAMEKGIDKARESERSRDR